MNRFATSCALFTGLLLVSTAGPFLRCAEMDAFAVSFWRLLAAAIVFFLWGLATGGLRIARADFRRTAAAGLLFAAQMALWVWAFDLTDYSSNLLLLAVQPVVAALIGARMGERTSRTTWLAIAIAVVGLLIIAGGDFTLGLRALAGDLVSVCSCVFIALFFAMTREARRATPLPAFLAVAMGAGAVALLPVVLLTHSRLTGYPGRSWGWLAGLVLITTVGGHGLMNDVARRVTLFTVNVVIILEPAIGIALGVPLFGATVTPAQVAGGLVLSVAVVIGLLPEWSRHAEGNVAAIDGAQ